MSVDKETMMGGFKIEKDRPAGLCGSCAYAEVRQTCDNAFTVRCEANDKMVLRPIQQCSDYILKDPRKEQTAAWMKEMSWLAVKIDGRKTFVHPDSKEAETATFTPFAAWGELKKGKKAAFK